MIDKHSTIDAEYCLAEGGGVGRTGGRTRATTSDHREGAARRRMSRAGRRARVRAAPGERRGPSSNAVAKIVGGRRSCASTKRPARISGSSRRRDRRRGGARYRDVLSPDRRCRSRRRLDARARARALVDAAHLGRADDTDRGLSLQVIPSERRRRSTPLHPDEDQETFLDRFPRGLNDPSIEVRWARERYVRQATRA